MKRLLREPLLHFLVLGALLFALHAGRGGGAGPADSRIVVTRGTLATMAANFQLTWQRPPTREEMDGLVGAYVREEILAREAVALGLDRDDPVIRRRLQQKMEFVAHDLADLDEPSVKDLRAYFEKHPDRFREEPRVTFRQIFVDPEKHGAGLESESARLKALLDAGTDPATLGDATLLPASMADAPNRDVLREFGNAFAEGLAKAPEGRWHGVRSTFGPHLVRVEKRVPGRMPAFEEVRSEVARECSNDRRREGNARFYEGLRARYAVVIEPPPAGSP